jgi:hypothetical protein
MAKSNIYTSLQKKETETAVTVTGALFFSLRLRIYVKIITRNWNTISEALLHKGTRFEERPLLHRLRIHINANNKEDLNIMYKIIYYLQNVSKNLTGSLEANHGMSWQVRFTDTT